MRSFAAALGPKALGADVLVWLARRRLSGVLAWGGSGSERQLVFVEGRPEHGTAGGQRPAKQKPEVIALVRLFGATSSGRCTFRALAASTAAQAAGLPEGATGSSIDTLGEAVVSLLLVLTAAQLEAFWAARGRYHVFKVAPTFAAVAAAVRQVSGGALLAPPEEGKALGPVVGPLELAAQRAWAVMVVLGGVVLSAPELALEIWEPEPAATGSTAASPPTNASISPAAASPPPTAGSADAEQQAFTLEIEQIHSRLSKLSHYEALGVAREASAAEVRKAFFALAKRWHSDQLAVRQLDPATVKKAEELFRRAEEAHRVLSNAEERKAYDWALSRQEQGLPTDAKVILEAETLFHKAELMVRRGQAQAAEPLLRRAVSMNPGEAEFWAFWGFALFSAGGPGAAAEAREHIAQALSLRGNLDVAYEFLGRMARVEGKREEAAQHLQRALELNPKNVEAQRELRLVTMRDVQEKEASTGAGTSGRGKKRGGGFLGRLFSKKAGGGG